MIRYLLIPIKTDNKILLINNAIYKQCYINNTYEKYSKKNSSIREKQLCAKHKFNE